MPDSPIPTFPADADEYLSWSKHQRFELARFLYKSVTATRTASDKLHGRTNDTDPSRLSLIGDLVGVEPDSGVRLKLLNGLIRSRHPDAIAGLINALSAPEALHQRMAARALGGLRATQAVSALVPLLDVPELRHRVSNALVDIGEKIAAGY